MIITVPQHRWLWSVTDEQACHVRRYTKKELVYKVESTGLRVEYVSSFVSLLLPLMILSRLLTKSDKQRDPMYEFRIPGWLNRSLEKVMNFELWLLSLGIRFPFGGSLLLLARKP